MTQRLGHTLEKVLIFVSVASVVGEKELVLELGDSITEEERSFESGAFVTDNGTSSDGTMREDDTEVGFELIGNDGETLGLSAAS